MPEKCDPSRDLKDLRDIVCWVLGVIARPFESAPLIREILSHTMSVSGSHRADLLMYQSDMNILFFSETASSNGSDSQGKLSLADTKNSAPVEALIGGHSVLVDEVSESGFLSFSQGSRTLLSIPVIYNDRIHGVLNIEHPDRDAFSPEEVRWMESIASILAQLLDHSYLHEQVFRLNQQLIDNMAEDASATDPGFRSHAERVALLAAALARQLRLESTLVDAVRDSGYLHDIGKSGVSDSILVKPGELTSQEMDQIKRHPVLGRFLLKPLGFQPAVIEGVVSHHERWDGNGYPRGLQGENIPITGRILAVAEAYDVMTSEQPYRKPISHEEAIHEIHRQSGSQFDPDVVSALTMLDFNEL